MRTMKAAVFIAPGRIVLDDKPVPAVGPGEALIRITTTTICGTDVHILKGEHAVAPGRIVGHEPVGVIDALGTDVAGYTIGQRVIVGAITPCGQCYPCLDGHHSQCGGQAMGGWRFGNTIDGAQAEYLLVPHAAANLTPVPDGLTDRIGVPEVDRDVGPHSLGHRQAFRNAVDGDDAGRALEFRPGGRAQTNRALSEHRHRIADLDLAVFRPAKARAHDVRAHQHLFVGEPVGHGGEICRGVRHQQVLRLSAIDGVPEAPTAHGFAAALRVVAVQARMALSARRDRADDDALPDAVAGDARS